jgi:Zn-dependent protease
MLKTLLLLLNAAKLGKVLTTGGTMLLSVFAYALVFGWRYAVGFVLLIFVHEMGHYLAARQRGLAVGAPTFIPFVGAWIELKDQPHDARTEAYIALAGPLVGTLGALACYVAAREEGSRLLLALAYAGFMINLWNLIPINPLDGGRIVGVLSPKIWLIGLPLLLTLLFVTWSPMLILILVFALPSVMSVWRGTWREQMPAGYYEQPLEVKLKYGAAYLGLAAFLAAMSHEVYVMLQAAPR